MTDTLPPLLLDAQAIAAMLSVSLRHVRALDATGRLPRSITLGRSRRWRCESCATGARPAARRATAGRGPRSRRPDRN